MPQPTNKISQFWQELKRRKVFRVVTMYAATAFIIMEAGDIMLPRLGLPDWTVTFIIVLLIIGFPIAIILSWIFDLTPEGIRKTEQWEMEPKDISLQEKSRRKLKISDGIIAVLFVAVCILLYPKILNNDSSPFADIKTRTIAVLPLKIIGDAEDVDLLAIGLVESITHMLAKAGNDSRAFTVIPASEILETITAGEARQRFGASLVISGSIQKDNYQTRLIFNLIDTKNKHLLKSEKLNYNERNNMLLQDKAVLRIKNMLELSSEFSSQQHLDTGGPISHAANDFYLRGRGSLLHAITTKDLDISIGLFEKAIMLDSLFALAYSGLGEAYWEKYTETKDIDCANSALWFANRAIALSENDAYNHISMGIILGGKGEFDDALAAFRKAIELDPNNEQSYIQIGSLYRTEGKFAQAEEFFKKALEIKPDYWRCYSHLGASYYYNGQYEEAIIQFKQGLELAPDNQNLLMNLAGSYYQLLKISDAIEAFEHLHRSYPDNANVISNLGTVNFYTGKFDKAIFYYKQDLEIRPDNYMIVGWLADAYYWSHQEATARDMYLTAIKKARENIQFDAGAQISIAYYHGMLGNSDSAYYYLERIIPVNPDEVDTYKVIEIGEVYLSLGEIDKATKWIESSLKRDHGWVQVKYHPMYKDLVKNLDFQKMISKYSTEHE